MLQSSIVLLPTFDAVNSKLLLQQKIIYYQLSYQAMSGSGKSQIKSKKTKLLQKKQEKSKQNNKAVQVIVSSEDEYHNQSIEKRRKGQPKRIEQLKKYNTFNIQKLKKVEYQPNKALLNQKALVVEQTNNENPMQHPQARITFSYKLQGQQATKYVSDMHLQQRARKIAQEELSKVMAQEKEKENKQKEQLAEEEKESEQVEERKRASRYFQNIQAQEQNRLVKCFRCGKKGHIAKNCLEQKLQAKCTYCLGYHHHHDCNSRACFRCNELGHIAQECRASGSECRKCGKKGHAQKNCGAIVYLDFSRIKSDHQYRQKYNVQDLKRLRCMAGCTDPNGHFNCHKYQQFHKYLPYDTFMRYNDHPQFYHNSMGSSRNHSFIDYERQIQQYRPSHSSKGNQRKEKHTYKQNNRNNEYQNRYSYDERSYPKHHQNHSNSNNRQRYNRRSQRW